MIKRLDNKELVGLFNLLNQDYRLYLPAQKKEGLFGFEEAVDLDLTKIDADSPQTMLPPTLFLLPLKEELFTIKRNRFQENPTLEQKVVMGVKSYDMEAINRLTRIFQDDHFFNQRKKNYLIITTDNNHQTDFDKILLDKKIAGFDLMIRPNGQDYLLISDSKKGDQIISDLNLATNEINNYQPIRKTASSKQVVLSLEKITWAIEKTKGGKVWQKWANICLGCGNCSYVCPMCFCYDINDQPNLDGNITRFRQRTSCFGQPFDQMAGHHPKQEFVNRFYHWYYHKFVAMPQQYGFSGCVNCGRCIKYCPVEINFRTVINEAVKEAENE